MDDQNSPNQAGITAATPSEEVLQLTAPLKPSIYSPGGLFPNGLLFEQIEDGCYVVWDATFTTLLREKVISYAGDIYAPLSRPLWPLAGTPQDYDAVELWSEIRRFISEHLWLPDDDLYDCLTAWIIASWTPELFSVISYICFYGPPGSGKTRGLEVLDRLAYRAILAVDASTAAIAYAIETWKATIILDESEIYSRPEKSDIIGILNAGYRVGQHYMRIRYVDGQRQPDFADTFSFKAFAGTRSLAKTLESRSLVIRMIKNQRKVPLYLDEKRARNLRSKLLTYRMRTLTPAVHTTRKEDLEKSVAERIADLSAQLLAKAPPLDLSNARNNELFQCLLAVSNHGREHIMAYAQRMDDVTRNEEMASEEAELAELLSKMKPSHPGNVVLTSEIRDLWNAGRDDREQWNARSLGWLIRRLGFTKKHTGQGNGWVIDPERLELWRQTYCFPEKSAETSQSSPDGPSSMTGRELSELPDVSPREADRTGLFVLCSVCHEEVRPEELLAAPGKPTCKRCAGEQQEGLSTVHDGDVP